MRIGVGDEFLRTTGGSLTGALTISANAGTLLTLNRPDGAAHSPIASQRAGITDYLLRNLAAEPFVGIADAAAASRLTLRTDTGLLGTSLIPLGLMRRDEADGTNAGAITLLVGQTTIVSVATAVNVAVGDRILVMAAVTSLTKGATAGNTNINVFQTAGTATGFFHNNAAALAETQIRAVGEVGDVFLAGIYRISGAGTLTLTLRGSSAGSNSTIAIGNGELHLLVLRDGA